MTAATNIGLTKREWEGKRPEEMKNSGLGKALQACEKSCQDPTGLEKNAQFVKAGKDLEKLKNVYKKVTTEFNAKKKELGKGAKDVQAMLTGLKSKISKYGDTLKKQHAEFTKTTDDKRCLLKGIREAKSRKCTFAVAFKNQTEGQVRIGKKEAEITLAGKKDKREEGGKPFMGQVFMTAGKLVFEFDGKRTVPKSMVKFLKNQLIAAGVTYKPRVTEKNAAMEEEEEAQA